MLLHLEMVGEGSLLATGNGWLSLAGQDIVWFNLGKNQRKWRSNEVTKAANSYSSTF